MAYRTARTRSLPFSLLAGFGFLIALLPQSVWADTILPVMSEYSSAGDDKAWRGTGKKEIPQSLIRTVTVENPSRAHQAPYPFVFLQNDRVVVCSVDCELPQDLAPERVGDDYQVGATLGSKQFYKNGSDSIVRQATVYYWVNALFDSLENLGYRPQRRLIVRVDRDVPSPVTGKLERNNAFFNDRDWSLSFLPADSNLMSKIAKLTFRPSAYDPSVAMHEAMHSVFEELVGDIMNSEVFGLHEAFADYFALAVLGDSRLGLVMSGGKPLRDASVPRAYEPRLEAHDLGEVVVYALWKIRSEFADPLAADRIALDAIRKLSSNLYANAGSVIAAYLAAFDQTMAPDASLRARVVEIWTQTGLSDLQIPEDLEPLLAPIDSSKFMTTSLRTWIPGGLAHEYGLEPLSHLSITLIERRPGPPGSGAMWQYVAVGDQNQVTPLWVLYSPDTQHIYRAYDQSLNFIEVNRPDSKGDALRSLLRLGQEFGTILNWSEILGKDVYEMYRNRGFMRLLMKAKRREKDELMVRINQRLIPANKYSVIFKRTLINRIVNGLAQGALDELNATKSLKLITVASRHLGDSRLIEAMPGEKIVGYEVELKTGVKSMILIEGIAELAETPQVAPTDAAENAIILNDVAPF